VACKREFATYNTLSVQADDVTYDPSERILEAHGNVETQDESGEHKAHSVTFYVHDGQAILMHQDR
jgi:lipopolysaccharide assembly outer membrane protein LptD (OstA)